MSTALLTYPQDVPFTYIYYDNKEQILNTSINTLTTTSNTICFDVNFKLPSSHQIYAKFDTPNINIECGVILYNNLTLPKHPTIISTGETNGMLVKLVEFNITSTEIGMNTVYIKCINPQVNIKIIKIIITGTNNLNLIPPTQDIINQRNAGSEMFPNATFKIENPTYVYREITVINTGNNTYADMHIGASSVGFIFEKQQIEFHVEDGIINKKYIPNTVVDIGENVNSIRINNPAPANHLYLPYTIKLNIPYGFMLSINNFTDNDKNPYSLVSCYFIDCSTVQLKWIKIGTVKRYASSNFFSIKKGEIIQEGTFKHLDKTDGLLRTRCIKIDNSYASDPLPALGRMHM